MNHSSLFFDRSLDKGRLKQLIRWTFENYGSPAAVELAERLKNVGFRAAASAGISLGIEDLRIPEEKRLATKRSELTVRLSEVSTARGAATVAERSQARVQAWARASESRKNAIVDTFRSFDPLSPLYRRAFSGARGNRTQVRQLIGRRGLRVDPLGRLVEFPIRSNFKEGRTLTEFLISCYGARKGIVDTALRTATAGYLTRRLVDVGHYQVIGRLDCGTRRAIRIQALYTEEGRILTPVSERWIGRALAHPLPGVAPRNTFLTHELAERIAQLGINPWVRSTLSCRAGSLGPRPERFQRQRYLSADVRDPAPRLRGFSLCQRCYGWSLADAGLVHLGEAVGILAAQSIGEPGTQLTRRTFHTGGVFSAGGASSIRASMPGRITFAKRRRGRLARTRTGRIGFLTREAGTRFLEDRELPIPPSTLLFVRHGQTVLEGFTLAEKSLHPTLREGEVVVRRNRTPHGGQVLYHEVQEKQKGRTDSFSRIRLLAGETVDLPTRSGRNGSFPFEPGDLLSPSGIASLTKLAAPPVAGKIYGKTGERHGFQKGSYSFVLPYDPFSRSVARQAWKGVASNLFSGTVLCSPLTLSAGNGYEDVTRGWQKAGGPQPEVARYLPRARKHVLTSANSRILAPVTNKQARSWSSPRRGYDSWTDGKAVLLTLVAQDANETLRVKRKDGSRQVTSERARRVYPNDGRENVRDSQGFKLRAGRAGSFLRSRSNDRGEFVAWQTLSSVQTRQLFLGRHNVGGVQIPRGAEAKRLGAYCSPPLHVVPGAGALWPGYLRSYHRGRAFFRRTTDWNLPPDSLLRGAQGDLLPRYWPITASRGRSQETGDITSGIPRVDSLLEARERSGIAPFVQGLHERFQREGLSPRLAVRKSIYAAQRAIIENVQRIYRTNGVVIDDKHLELIVRPRGFGEVSRDSAWHEPLARGEVHPIDVLERANQLRALYNLTKATGERDLYPRIEYQPLLLGLTRASLLTTSESFLSAASFQETSRVLARSGVRGRTDYLLGLKENLILGTRLPIGTASRHLLLLPKEERSSTTRRDRRWDDRPNLPKEPSWLDALVYLGENG